MLALPPLPEHITMKGPYMQVPGFTVDTKVWQEAVDALELIGLG